MVWPGYWAIFWAVLSVAFVVLSNRLRPTVCMLATGGFVLVGTLVLHFLLALFNLRFDLDTP